MAAARLELPVVGHARTGDPSETNGHDVALISVGRTGGSGSSGARSPAGDDVIPFRDERGIPSFTMRVAGRDVEADLDAGSVGGIVSRDSMASRLPLASAPRAVGHARTVSNSFDIEAAGADGDVSVS